MSSEEIGECLCGQLRCGFDRDAVVSAHHCHCKDCQKITGSGKATIIMVPTDALSMQGEYKTFTVTGTDGSHVTRGFCPTCGSQMISYVEELPSLRFIKAGTLSDSSWVRIDSSFWSDTAEAWSPVDASSQSFEKNPPMDALG